LEQLGEFDGIEAYLKEFGYENIRDFTSLNRNLSMFGTQAFDVIFDMIIYTIQSKSYTDLQKCLHTLQFIPTQESVDFLVALVFIVLVIQCRCFIQPIVILMTIPLSFIGVILGMVVTHNPFGMMAFIGLVCLLGSVVNNAIVLLTYINILRKRGMEREAAIVRAAQTRLHPILMTTITTIAGVLSTTLGIGGGVDFWTPLGWAIIWGLLTATVLTLVVVPVAYSLMEGTKERMINWLWDDGEGALDKG
jgi:Cu/Ag efflux pump CusA